MISVNSKADFIRWFLSNQGVKNRDENWFLNYLLSNIQKLNNVVFVEGLNGLENGASFFSTSFNEVFKYRKDGREFLNIQELFADFKNSPEKTFYFSFEFPNKFLSSEFLEILEYPLGDSVVSEVDCSDKDLIELDSFHTQIEKLNRENYLRLKIDEALSEKDKDLFYKYSEELNSLLELGV